jgi:hypothetical protein
MFSDLFPACFPACSQRTIGLGLDQRLSAKKETAARALDRARPIAGRAALLCPPPCREKRGANSRRLADGWLNKLRLRKAGSRKKCGAFGGAFRYHNYMSMKVAIFEDDKDLADTLKEFMDNAGFEVNNFYRLDARDWDLCDVVLGDYRNTIVPFGDLRRECVELNIPLLAISGAETEYRPQLLKPFTIDEVQSGILEAIKATPGPRRKRAKHGPSLLSRLTRHG